MAFNQFKANNHKKCIVCGASLIKYQPNQNMASTRISSRYDLNKEEFLLCDNCYNLIIKTRVVTNIVKQRFSAEAAMPALSEYNEYVRRAISARCSQVKHPYVKDDLHILIQEANAVYDEYHNYNNLIKKSFDIIKDNLNRIPNNSVDCGISTIAVDEDGFFYLEYGKPIVLNKQSFDTKDPALRIETAQELMKNVINNKDSILFIPLENIHYYQEKGDISYSTKIDGTGGQVNIGGAVAGTLLFGVIGGIVGSRTGEKAKTSINSQTIEHDNRYVILRYIDDNDKVCEMKFGIEFLEAFSTLIPEKEYSYVQLNNTTDNNAPAKSRLPVEELKELKSLLDMGIITQEEFETTKKKLLDF